MPPTLITPSSAPLDLAFHPSAPVLAVSTVTGSLVVYTYSADTLALSSAPPTVRSGVHAGGARTLVFCGGGALASGGADGGLAVTSVEKGGGGVWSCPGSHGTGVNLVRSYGASGCNLLSGDEDGLIRTWDTRVKGGPGCHTSSFSSQTDVATDAVVVEEKSAALVASADGTLAIYDLRRPPPPPPGKPARMPTVKRSLPDEDAYTCCGVVGPGGGTVLAGTSEEGCLEVWEWGGLVHVPGAAYGPSRFRGHPESVECLAVMDEEWVATGCADGKLRLVRVGTPLKVVTVVGSHPGGEGVERVGWSGDRRVLGSLSLEGEAVRLWDCSKLDAIIAAGGDGGGEDDDEEDEEEEDEDDDEEEGNEGEEDEDEGEEDGEEGGSDAASSSSSSSAAPPPAKRGKPAPKAAAGFFDEL